MLRLLFIVILFVSLLPVVYRLTKSIFFKVQNELESAESLEEQEEKIVAKTKKSY